jgi:hypothetical protein
MSSLDISDEEVPIEEATNEVVDEPNITTSVEDVDEELADEEVAKEPADPEPVEEAETVESETVESETVESETVESETVESETVESETAKEPVPEESTPEEVKSSDNDLENRVKVLEEKLEKLNKNLIIWFESFRAGSGRGIDISEFYNI